MRSLNNCLWDLKTSTIHAILTLSFSNFFFNFFSNFFFTDENHLGWLQNDNHWNSSATSRLTSKRNHTYQKRQKIRNLSKMCLTGHATGGDIWMLLCSQRGDTENVFRKVDSFWRFSPLLPNRQKLSTFRKNSLCPPVANTVTPKCPPNVACPVRDLTTSFGESM